MRSRLIARASALCALMRSRESRPPGRRRKAEKVLDTLSPTGERCIEPVGQSIEIDPEE